MVLNKKIPEEDVQSIVDKTFRLVVIRDADRKSGDKAEETRASTALMQSMPILHGTSLPWINFLEHWSLTDKSVASSCLRVVN